VQVIGNIHPEELGVSQAAGLERDGVVVYKGLHLIDGVHAYKLGVIMLEYFTGQLQDYFFVGGTLFYCDIGYSEGPVLIWESVLGEA